MEYKLENLEEQYFLELDRIIATMQDKKPETVLLQLPDGLKPWALILTDYIEEKTDAKVSIYLGDCFGACDTPESSTDLLIQFGHAPWGTGFCHSE